MISEVQRGKVLLPCAAILYLHIRRSLFVVLALFEGATQFQEIVNSKCRSARGDLIESALAITSVTLVIKDLSLPLAL
jgi:hypothetical protein